MARICFFARVEDRSVLDMVEFYAQDLDILRALGHEVVVATRARELVRADLYYCWWWTWAFLPLIRARFARRPVVITGVFDEWMFDTRPWYQRRLMRWSLGAASANVFISRLETAIVPSRFPTSAPTFAPCVVDHTVYAPGDTPREAFVLTVAWLNGDNARRKGIPELIRAAALVRERRPHVRFVIAGGHGSGYPALRSLVEDLGLSEVVSFPGSIAREEKIRLMQRCGVYLQPSRFEGFGVAVLEAMSCGAPVVTSRGGALPEVVGDAGVALRDLEPSTIADAVCDVLDRPQQAATLGGRARARAVSEFSYTRRRDHLASVLDPLLGRSKS